jgi:hypothetical protein
MAPVRDRIEELAQLVASGRDVDWEAVLSTAADDDERRAIEQLRAVDGIAHGGGTAVAEATQTQRVSIGLVVSSLGEKRVAKREMEMRSARRGGLFKCP